MGAGGFEQAPLTSAYARAYRISRIQAIFSHFPVRARFFAFERVTKWVIFHRSAYTPPVSLTQPSRQLHHGHQQRGYTICDCEFAVRFHSGTNVAGYDPEKYLKQYRDADSDVNAMRRIDYAARKDAINAQKRAAYAARTHDFMGKPVDFSDKHGNISIKAYQVKGHDSIFTQTNSTDAQNTIRLISGRFDDIQQLQHVQEIVVAKNIHGIAAYDHAVNRLYVNERLSNAAYIKEQLSGNYFVAENANDVLLHEMHHKEHWDHIKTKVLTSGKSSDIVKQEIESALREYVQNQLASDPAYIRKMSVEMLQTLFNDMPL